MKKKWIAVVGTGALATGLAVAGASFAQSQAGEVRAGSIRIPNQSVAEFASMATISMDQAIQNALASVQGQVLKAGLEDENGFLIYAVEVLTPDNSVADVKVDAGTGEVLAVDRGQAGDEGYEYGEHGDRNGED